MRAALLAVVAALVAAAAAGARPAASQTLAVSTSGPGTVASSPKGISCPGVCSAQFTTASTVTLTAQPNAGARFVSWSGDCTGSGACTVTMTGDRSVTATFATESGSGSGPTLRVTVSGIGSVASNPAGITCPSDCSQSYTSGTTVTLTAQPASGNRFVGWGGACTGTTTCSLTMTSDRAVTATFAAGTSGPTLTVSVSGGGAVTSSPAGISCPTACSASFASAQSVTLTALPSTGERFTGWGGACTGTATCTVSMTVDRAVTASFTGTGTTTAAPRLTVTVTGSGTVTSTPPAISCPSVCNATFATGQSVTLTAQPAAGVRFAGWGGSCTGTLTCTLALAGDRAVTATFGAGGSTGPGVPVTVTLSGDGTVTSTPAGIACPGTCTASFPSGSVVSLLAVPAATTSFSGWSGPCSGTGPCALVLTATAMAVRATFAPTAAPPITTPVLGSPPAARLVLGGRTWRGVAGDTLRGFVATFAASSVRAYAATVEWGDGRRSAGSVAPILSGSWSVLADHTYARAGRYAIRVTVTYRGKRVTTLHSMAEVTKRPAKARAEPRPRATARPKATARVKQPAKPAPKRR